MGKGKAEIKRFAVLDTGAIVDSPTAAKQDHAEYGADPGEAFGAK